MRWNDEELKKAGIDPDLFRSSREKFADAWGPPRARFYEVPVENGGPTDLEIAAFRRYHYNASQHAAGNQQYSSPYNKTYPAGSFIQNPKAPAVVRKATAHWDDWKKEKAEQDERDAEHARLCEERLEEVQPPDESLVRRDLVRRDRQNSALLCVVKQVERHADALEIKLEKARKYEVIQDQEIFRMQHLLEEEYERRVEAEYVQDEQEKEVTRLNMEVLRLKGLFESVSLVTHDALEGN